MARHGGTGLKHVIAGVTEGGLAYRLGVRAGDALVAINGFELPDQLEYQALTARRRLVLTLEKPDGARRDVPVVKSREQPLGLTFGDSMAIKIKRCRNRCVFCFVDQLPRGLRDSLYVKDDDWRTSVLMGSYVTLSNLDEQDMARILRLKPSPLYVSVHAADPAVRARLLGNPRAGGVMDILARFRQAGISFHSQIVVCPGLNDGEILDDTLEALWALRPASLSVALVPVGLTAHRKGLAALTPFDGETARGILARTRAWQARCLAEGGTRFVFAADELYCLSGEPLPEEDEYERYPQIENGVGLLRTLKSELDAARKECDLPPRPRDVLVACGESAAPYLDAWLTECAPPGVRVRVKAVRNDFFGHSVTVTGLLTGGDLMRALEGEQADDILVSDVVLRDKGDRLLDDMTAAELKAAVPALRFVPSGGEALYRALIGQANGQTV